MLLDVVTAAVLAFVGVRLVNGFRASLTTGGRALIGPTVRSIRWRHVWPVPLVLAAVLGASVALIQLPGLSFGWWTAIGGHGNPVFGQSNRTAGKVWEWLVPVVFLLLLTPALPLFARREEEIFRRGAESWSPARRAGRAVLFGLAHAVIGIPIGVALALSIGGGYFTWSYLRGWRASGGNQEAALQESTRAHTTYNGVILVVVLLATVLSAVTG